MLCLCLQIAKKPPDEPVLILSSIAVFKIENASGVVWLREQATFSQNADKCSEDICDDTERETDRGEAKQGEAGSSTLCQSFMDYVTGDDEKNGANVGRIRPSSCKIWGALTRTISINEEALVTGENSPGSEDDAIWCGLWSLS